MKDKHRALPMSLNAGNQTRRSSFPRQARLLSIVALLLLSACTPVTTHVLFIGNSFSYFNEGLGKQMEGLDPGTAATMVVEGGFSLEDHWNKGEALKAIRKGGWDVVILQEQSQGPVIHPAEFFESVKDFDVEVRAAGGRTVLLMTWERPDSVEFGVTTENLAAAYNRVGRELDIKVAPAGLAFARAQQERPDIILNTEDGHPTLYGTYLAACVIYGTIFEKSPLGIKFADRHIPADKRDFLQQVAADTLGD